MTYRELKTMLESIFKSVNKNVNVDFNSIDLTNSTIKDLGLDSFDQMAILAEIEEQIGVDPQVEEEFYDVETVQQFLDFVAKLAQVEKEEVGIDMFGNRLLKTPEEIAIDEQSEVFSPARNTQEVRDPEH